MGSPRRHDAWFSMTTPSADVCRTSFDSLYKFFRIHMMALGMKKRWFLCQFLREQVNSTTMTGSNAAHFLIPPIRRMLISWKAPPAAPNPFRWEHFLRPWRKLTKRKVAPTWFALICCHCVAASFQNKWWSKDLVMMMWLLTTKQPKNPKI